MMRSISVDDVHIYCEDRLTGYMFLGYRLCMGLRIYDCTSLCNQVNTDLMKHMAGQFLSRHVAVKQIDREGLHQLQY